MNLWSSLSLVQGMSNNTSTWLKEEETKRIKLPWTMIIPWEEISRFYWECTVKILINIVMIEFQNFHQANEIGIYIILKSTCALLWGGHKFFSCLLDNRFCVLKTIHRATKIWSLERKDWWSCFLLIMNIHFPPDTKYKLNWYKSRYYSTNHEHSIKKILSSWSFKKLLGLWRFRTIRLSSLLSLSIFISTFLSIQCTF